MDNLPTKIKKWKGKIRGMYYLNDFFFLFFYDNIK